MEPQEPQEGPDRRTQDEKDEAQFQDELKALAQGKNPEWKGTFTHPVYGPLTFKAKLPTAFTLAEHSIAMDNLTQDLYGAPRPGTLILVAAIAGVATLMDPLPVIRERRVEDEDNSKTRLEQDLYDPYSEISETFLADVWMTFSAWRERFVNRVDTVDELGNSSGETDSRDSSEESSARTDSPSTIPA